MFKVNWVHDWLGWFILLTLLVGIVVTINLSRDIGRPFGGYLNYYNATTNSWKVDIITPGWWPGIFETGLKTNDHLLQINGQPYAFGIDEAKLFRNAYVRSDSLVSLKVERGGVVVEKQVQVIPFTFAHYLDLIIPHWLGGIMFWLLALIVYRIPSQEPLNKVFIATCCLGAINRWSNRVGLFFAAPDNFTRVLDLLGFSFFFLLGSLFIHFAFLFPSRSSLYNKRFIYFVYAISCLGIISSVYSRFLLWSSGPSMWVSRLDYLGFVIAWPMSVIGIAAILTRLIVVSFRNPSQRLRKQAHVMLIGVSLILPYLVAVWATFLIGGEYTIYWSGLDTRYLVAAGPAAAALMILRYQTFRRTPTIFLIIPVLALSAIIANIGSVVWAWTLPQPVGSWVIPPFIPALGMTLISSFIWVTQSSWQGFFGRILHWKRHNEDAAKRFGHFVISQVDVAAMPESIALALVNELLLERAAVWTRQEKTKSFQLVGESGQWEKSLPKHLMVPFEFEFLQEPIQLGEQSVKLPSWLEPLGQHQDIAMLVPLWVSTTMTGFLGLGKRWDEEIFDERDLDIIELIAQQSALFLLTSQQVEQLREVPNHIAVAQENERLKLAQELHDTVQQFLGRLPFYLEVSRRAMWETPSEAEKLLDKSIIDVEEAAKAVRQIRNNLAPSQLEYGLIQPIVGLSEQFEQRTGAQVECDLQVSLDNYLSVESRHALYRVIQQALENIALHAQATTVSVAMSYKNNRVVFLIEDNGQGSSEEEREQKQIEGAFGLHSMAARIQSVGGYFELRSSKGLGTTIQGWVPSSSKRLR